MTIISNPRYAIKIPIGEDDWLFLTEDTAPRVKGELCDIQVKLFDTYEDAFDYSCLLFQDKQHNIEIINYEKYKKEQEE